MIWLIGSLAYGVLALTVARLVAGHLAWAMNERACVRDRARHPSIHNPGEFATPSGERWFNAWCVALMLAVAWPLAVLPWVVGRRFTVGAESQAQHRMAEARVRQLEEELGIR